MDVMAWFALAFVGIVVPLAVYAVMLLRRLQQQRRQQAQAREDLKLRQQQSRQKAAKSILLLLRALKQKEVTATEAAIRITALARVLPLPQAELDQIQVFQGLAEDTAHIPILDEWRKLHNEQQERFDKERVELESRYRQAMDTASDQLLASESLSSFA